MKEGTKMAAITIVIKVKPNMKKRSKKDKIMNKKEKIYEYGDYGEHGTK